uniref:Uncharacterized protein n=1 Tax=Lepeophtheirus salmonis TaxID=72036 RepID=A0A0K2TUN2_LEPSM
MEITWQSEEYFIGLGGEGSQLFRDIWAISALEDHQSKWKVSLCGKGCEFVSYEVFRGGRVTQSRSMD